MIFAPDSTLFVGSSEQMQFDPAQNLASNLGKIVRVQRDGSAPLDNPFVATRAAQPEIWSIVSDNWRTIVRRVRSQKRRRAQHHHEAENYGWPLVSEGVNYDDSAIPHHLTRPEFVRFVRGSTPVISPGHLMFYTGTQFPPWQSNAFVRGLSSQAIIQLAIEGEKMTAEKGIPMGRRIRTLLQGYDRSLLVLTVSSNAELLRLTPAR